MGLKELENLLLIDDLIEAAERVRDALQQMIATGD